MRVAYRVGGRLLRGDALDDLEDGRPMPGLAFERPAELILETSDRVAQMISK